jgi:hypothetical protein
VAFCCSRAHPTAGCSRCPQPALCRRSQNRRAMAACSRIDRHVPDSRTASVRTRHAACDEATAFGSRPRSLACEETRPLSAPPGRPTSPACACGRRPICGQSTRRHHLSLRREQAWSATTGESDGPRLFPRCHTRPLCARRHHTSSQPHPGPTRRNPTSRHTGPLRAGQAYLVSRLARSAASVPCVQPVRVQSRARAGP